MAAALRTASTSRGVLFAPAEVGSCWEQTVGHARTSTNARPAGATTPAKILTAGSGVAAEKDMSLMKRTGPHAMVGLQYCMLHDQN